jgi:hypothetical protein
MLKGASTAGDDMAGWALIVRRWLPADRRLPAGVAPAGRARAPGLLQVARRQRQPIDPQRDLGVVGGVSIWRSLSRGLPQLDVVTCFDFCMRWPR